jgi:hypothetical protein
MSRVAAYIEAPPGTHDTWDALILCSAVTVLEAVRSRPGRIATFSEDEFDTWRASVRLHRDAWRNYEAHTIADSVQAAEQTEAQGRAAGWWVDSIIPPTLTIPLIDPREAADVLLHYDPDGGEAWAWALAKACRRVRQESA